MFKRIGNLIQGFFGLFVGGLEKRNPEALLEVERENLRKQIGQYNQGLAAHAGLCERLITQVKKLELEERELRAKTTAFLRSDNRDAAGQTALRLQTIQRELTEDRTQLEQAETTYRELIRARDVAIKNAQSKIEALRFGLDDLKIKKATAELTQMASGMITQIGGSGELCNGFRVWSKKSDKGQPEQRELPGIRSILAGWRSKKLNTRRWRNRHSPILLRPKGFRSVARHRRLKPTKEPRPWARSPNRLQVTSCGLQVAGWR